jgi:hypothetical protein
MTTITLKIVPKNGRQVQAQAKKAGDGGNAVLPAQGKIEWKASGSDVYRVIFQDLDDGTANKWIFPFVGNDDGVFGPNNAPSLEVTGAGETRELRPDAPANIKYMVYSTSSPNADFLDPVIIIRQKSGASESMLLGVTCAVLGAFAGALLTALWT